MKKYFFMLLAGVLFFSCARKEPVGDVGNRHFFYGQPQGTPASNNLIVREIYALSSNDTRKMADWVCYRLDAATLDGDVKTTRRWRPDPLLRDEETLEPTDYKGAHAALKVDRGHQAPLASFKGTKFWQETNYLSNITPQKSELNQGSWRILEEKVRDLVRKGEPVWVMTGPLYERKMPVLPKADEVHRVPSGYWKIICVGNKGTTEGLKIAAFIFDQNTPRKSRVLKHLANVDEIEKRSGLDVLWMLPDELENEIEKKKDSAWAQLHF